jgi:hypothetical protein
MMDYTGQIFYKRLMFGIVNAMRRGWIAANAQLCHDVFHTHNTLWNAHRPFVTCHHDVTKNQGQGREGYGERTEATALEGNLCSCERRGPISKKEEKCPLITHVPGREKRWAISIVHVHHRSI